MNFDLIIEKFNYEPAFGQFLKEVYYELINYFGNEEIVFNALMNTPIVSVNNAYDYLKENDLLDDNEQLVTDGDMKRSAGVCNSVPEISYNSTTNSFEMANVKRCVAVVNLDLTSTSSKATLIHEICHLIKSYYNEYVIEGNHLIAHSGLIESHYELSYNGEKVIKNLVNEIGVGLEEGLTSVAEEEITRSIVDSEYQSSGYGVVNAIARHLLELPEIKEVVVNAQIYHNKDELFYKLGAENYTELDQVSNKIYELSLKMFSEVFEYEKMQKTAELIKEIIRNEYLPIKTKLETNYKRT